MKNRRLTSRAHNLAGLLLLLLLTGASSSLQGSPNQPSQSAEVVNESPTPHFWDPIPVSSSTTVPGQIKDDYWQRQFQRVNREVAASKSTQLVFFGDSITWHWTLGSQPQLPLWQQAFGRYHPINMGNSGDITPVMLYRVTHGNLDFAKDQQPKVAVILCGTNNFGVTQSHGGKVKWKLGVDTAPKDVANGIRAIAQVFRRKLPQTRLVVLGIFPVVDPTKQAKCQEVNAINASLAYNEDEVVYLDISNAFLKPDGMPNRSLFADGTHPNGKGYKAWAERIDPLIAKMIKAKPLTPKKIMLIGDSMVEGASSATAYRRYLDGMLRRDGHLIDFVGSQQQHHGNTTAVDSYEFDHDHEGYGGADTKTIVDKVSEQRVTNVPDLAVVHIGTDELVSTRLPAKLAVAGMMADLNRLVVVLRKKKTDVQIVLTLLSPIPGREDHVQQLNRSIAGLAETLTTAQSRVVVADLRDCHLTSKDLGEDGLRPNAIGAKKMAQQFTGTIQKLWSQAGR